MYRLWHIWEHRAEFVTDSQLWHRLAVMSCMATPLYKIHSSAQRQSSNFWVVFLLLTAAPKVQFLKSHHQESKRKKKKPEAVLRCCWGNVLWKKWRFSTLTCKLSVWFFCLLPPQLMEAQKVIQISKVMLYTLRGEKIKGIKFSVAVELLNYSVSIILVPQNILCSRNWKINILEVYGFT